MDANELTIAGADIALTILGIAFPEAAAVILVAKEIVPAWFAAKPYIDKAIANGESAFAAAKKAAPHLAEKIGQIAEASKSQFGATSESHLENVTRGIFQLPRMTFDEEKKWMDDATPDYSSFGG